MDLSVVIPVYNEEENAAELYERLGRALAPTAWSYELIFVDDGSTDRTLEILREAAARDPRVRVVKLRRNCGQTPAMKAGIDVARGRVIVTMDGDLQNDPDDIPRLVEKLNEGYDLVTGWRRNRKDALIVRKVPSRVANWIIAKLTRVPIHDTGCSLKAYRAEVVKNIPLYSELHRFIPAMVGGAGGRICEVVVRHHPRLRGKSKYGLSRIVRVFLDIVTVKMLLAFAERPLHWFGLFAAACLLAAAAAGGASLAAPLFGGSEAGVVFPAVAFLSAFLAAHFVVTGLVGELAVKTGKRYVFRSLSRLQSDGRNDAGRSGRNEC